MSFDLTKQRSITDPVIHEQRDLPDGTTAQQEIIVDETTGNKLSINADGSINTSGGSGPSGSVGLKNVAGSQINPATEDTLDDIKTDTDKFQFDGSGNLKVNAEAIIAENVGLKDISGSQINPAKEDGNLQTIAGAVSSSKMATKSADGDFVTVGAKGDTAVTDSTISNTLMSFLKGLVKILNDVWNSTSHYLKIQEQNPITGFATSDNQTNGTQQTKIKETVPTDPTKTNPSTVLSYTGANLTAITETIAGVQYRTTLTYDGSNVLTNISAAVQI